MTFQKINEKPWTCEDEKEHPGSAIEWWGVEAFFKTVENNKRWSFKGSMTEWLKINNNVGSNLITTLFDIDKNKHYNYYSSNEKEKLHITKDKNNIYYDNSFIRGSYPDYEVRFKDPKNKIELNIKYQAEALPHWVAQNVTNGWLPMRLGFFKYGFIPKNKLSGKLKIFNKQFDIIGDGYFEHVWGDFSYTNTFTYAKNLTKTTKTYIDLIKWWIGNNKLKIPKSIMFSRENNPQGYDWIWTVFDNGWSLFFGNSLFWLMKGPLFGIFIVTKDGKKYSEFGNGSFEYKKIKYVDKHDFFYPTEILLKTKKGNEKFHLYFKSSVENIEFQMNLSDKRNKFYICEGPGTVEGFYTNGNQKIPLKGICKIEPQRQIKKQGHNSLKIDFIKPPEGIGIDVSYRSHELKKQINTRIQFRPKPDFNFRIKKLKKNDFKYLDY